jgi:UDP-N-acetylglucosamine:LPS N-acetylglucosamine transferase
MGGGTGAVALNKAMWEIEPSLPPEIQVIHSTGKGKMERLEFSRSGYTVQEFLNAEEMSLAYAASDLIVSRAGFGAISECASLSKPMILVPLPNSPQERNVQELDGAVIPVRQTDGFSKTLHHMIVTMLEDQELREDFGTQLHSRLPTDRGDVLANLVRSMIV